MYDLSLTITKAWDSEPQEQTDLFSLTVLRLQNPLVWSLRQHIMAEDTAEGSCPPHSQEMERRKEETPVPRIPPNVPMT